MVRSNIYFFGLGKHQHQKKTQGRPRDAPFFGPRGGGDGGGGGGGGWGGGEGRSGTWGGGAVDGDSVNAFLAAVLTRVMRAAVSIPALASASVLHSAAVGGSVVGVVRPL